MASKALIIASAVIAVAVIGAAVFLALRNPNTPTSGNSSPSLDSSEMQSLFGRGTYNASPAGNATELGLYISTHSAGTNESYLANNVTAYYAAVYNVTGDDIMINGEASHPMVFEQVFQSPVARGIYSTVVSGAGNVLTTLNATSDGLTYSYARSDFTNVSMTDFIGQKGDETAMVTIVGENVSVPALVAAIAGDLK
jgi:hypothetical protein